MAILENLIKFDTHQIIRILINILDNVINEVQIYDCIIENNWNDQITKNKLLYDI